MTEIPNWYSLLLLALGSWRLFHLFAHDDILDKPRRYVTRLSPSWRQEGDATGERYREGLADFIQCGYCMGWWISLAVWGLWLGFPTQTVCMAAPLALNALLIGAQRVLSSE